MILSFDSAVPSSQLKPWRSRIRSPERNAPRSPRVARGKADRHEHGEGHLLGLYFCLFASINPPTGRIWLAVCMSHVCSLNVLGRVLTQSRLRRTGAEASAVLVFRVGWSYVYTEMDAQVAFTHLLVPAKLKLPVSLALHQSS